jgi:hypothetical protein
VGNPLKPYSRLSLRHPQNTQSIHAVKILAFPRSKSRFFGLNLNEIADLVLDRLFHDALGAEDVVFHRLPGVFPDHGDMLVGCRMEHDHFNDYDHTGCRGSLV